jgi:Holliday junction resolvase RusA-like endonuclease
MVTAYVSRPPSAPKRRRRPNKRPDWDNYAKLVCDALNGLAFADDSEIVEAHVFLYYAAYPDPPRTEVFITEVVEGMWPAKVGRKEKDAHS